MVIYIHIPFCIKKCDYCDFLSAPAGEDMRRRYVECLIKELYIYSKKYGKAEENTPVTSVFFGGGTPSILNGQQISDIMNMLKEKYNLQKNAEITIECNPGTITEDKLVCYRESGINRISMGLQSADDTELKKMGRIHTFAQFEEGFRLARKCGFNNINVDIMSALPGQTLESYMETIRKVLDCKPEHISAYSLILEEGTPLWEKIEKLERNSEPTGLPDEDTEREMYYVTERMLKEAGYSRYEISNYAMEGYQCRHNSAYWLREDYLGVGIGAASCIDGVRLKNITDIEEYIRRYEAVSDDLQAVVPDKYNAIEHSETEVLEISDIMAEFMFLGLRMMKGVSKDEFSRQFNVDFNEIYGDTVRKLIKEELLWDENGRVGLTPLGIDVSNMVLAQFIVD